MTKNRIGAPRKDWKKVRKGYTISVYATYEEVQSLGGISKFREKLNVYRDEIKTKIALKTL